MTQPESLRLADGLEKIYGLKAESAELRRLHGENRRQQGEIAALESFRPHWAMGYTSDSAAAQASTAALASIWEILEVRNQTEAVMKLRRLHEVNAELVEALKLCLPYVDAALDEIGGMDEYNAVKATRTGIYKATGEQQ